MWTSAIQLVFIGVYLQVPTCYPSCELHGLVANCPSRNHYWVPALPPNITHLYLEMNYISEINSSSLRNYDQLQQLDLGMQKSFLKWLTETNVTFPSPIEEYSCEFPATFHNLPLLNYSRVIEPCEEDDDKAVQVLQFALFISSALLVITLILSGIVYARLRGHVFIIYKKIIGRVLEGPKLNPPVDEVQYDAFLSFSENDYGWVEAALLKKLDNQFSEENLFRCCFEARDFLPGEDHLTNIRDAIWGSRKTVCVVSKEFLKDGWCLEAFTMAQGRMLEELTNFLVMVVVGKLAHYQLMKYHAVRVFVQRREYLTWPEDPQDLEWFYERLVSQILKDTKGKKFDEDKLEPAQPDVQPQMEKGIQLENIGAVPI
ncbi:hypothetical protein PBY51_007103 [Eleginops maclovinus]|uniref:TIR domain-containing protein n=1 Tax=Eleginops maclovinus TaxID=56733 RepID=A0AAN7X2Z2_ELEMC|nr:hypothetical protein PBY51_007103 [Eleginops maclovinus]